MLESALYDPARGTLPTLYNTATYPEETDFEYADEIIIKKIRRLIGDFKGLSRLYITDDDTSCQYLHEDGKTIEIKEKGWPVYVSVKYPDEGATEKIILTDPVVQGYKHLAFTDTLVSGTTMPIVDVWYHTFKFSDVEVYTAYEDSFIPAKVPSASVTQDHLILQSAIDLLENMTFEDIVEDGAVIKDDKDTYDPSPGLKERDKAINRLRKQLDNLIEETLLNLISGVTGVLID